MIEARVLPLVTSRKLKHGFEIFKERAMKKMQKMIWVMFTLIAANMIAPVYADDHVADEPGCRAHRHSDPVANVDKRLSVLRDELKLNRDQQQAWSVYAEQTRSNVKDMKDRMDEAMRDQPQTAPERFDRHIALMKARLANFEKMDDALKQLYAALTPEQKTIADRHFAKMRH